MSENPAVLKHQADAAYRAGHYTEAALLYARMRQAALDLRDASAAFEAGVWQVSCHAILNRSTEALGLLLPLLRDPPPEAAAYDRWLAQLFVFDIYRDSRPSLPLLQQALEDLRSLAQRQTHPAADISVMEGDLADDRGRRDDAAAHYAKGWQLKDGEGYVKHGFAWSATWAALRRNRIDEARAWRDHLARTNQDTWAEARQYLLQVDAGIALFTMDSAALDQCRDAGFGEDSELECRVLLALRGTSREAHDDPARARLRDSHPARVALRSRVSQNVRDRYDRRLTVVDYWLACLRYDTGLPATDDFYLQKPDKIPLRLTPSDPAAFADHLLRFRRAWKRLDRHARWLDGLLECDWRTKEAESRIHRCEAIVKATASKPALPTSGK